MNFDCGIYSIATRDGKEYIGQSQSLGLRWSRHISALSRGKGNPGLQAAYDKYGETGLSFRKIAIIPVDQLDAREQEQISARSVEMLHNVQTKIPRSSAGCALSELQRGRMSDSAKKKAKDPAHVERFMAQCQSRSSCVAKPIVCIELGLTFPSLARAGEWVRENIRSNASDGNISSVCTGRLKSAYGYTWRYMSAS